MPTDGFKVTDQISEIVGLQTELDALAAASATGATGPQGATGASITGPTGATGPIGPSGSPFDSSNYLPLAGGTLTGELLSTSPNITSVNATLSAASPFTATLSHLLITGGSPRLATVTTVAAHNFAVGQTAYINGSFAPVDGSWVIYSVPSPTTFTFITTISNTNRVLTGTAVVQQQNVLNITDSNGNILGYFTGYGGLVVSGYNTSSLIAPLPALTVNGGMLFNSDAGSFTVDAYGFNANVASQFTIQNENASGFVGVNWDGNSSTAGDTTGSITTSCASYTFQNSGAITTFGGNTLDDGAGNMSVTGMLTLSYNLNTGNCGPLSFGGAYIIGDGSNNLTISANAIIFQNSAAITTQNGVTLDDGSGNFIVGNSFNLNGQTLYIDASSNLMGDGSGNVTYTAVSTVFSSSGQETHNCSAYVWNAGDGFTQARWQVGSFTFITYNGATTIDSNANLNMDGVINPFARSLSDLGIWAVPGEASIAYCTDGCKVGESSGNGTGVPVYYSQGQWRVYSTDQPVTN